MRAALRLIFQRRTLLMISFVWVTTFVGSVTPLFTYMNESILFVAERFIEADGDSNTLLVTFDPSEVPDEAFLRSLVSELKDYDAKAIGVSRFPIRPGRALQQMLLDEGVVLGLSLQGILDLESNQRASFAVNDIPAVGRENGHEPWLHQGGTQYASFARALAGRVKAQVDLESESPDFFYIRYQAVGTLPSLSFDQVKSGSLIPELVQDRVIIIGPEGQENGVSLLTALGPIPVSAYHAYATEAMVRSLTIVPLGLLWSALTIAAASVVIISLLLTTRRYLFAVVGVTAVVWTLIWFLMIDLGTLLPLVEVFTILALAVLLIRRAARNEQREALQAIIAEYRQKLQERMTNRGFLEQEEHWQQILNLVNQTLELERVLFLERDPLAHRVKEIVAHNCNFDDIAEARRDYDREPYRTAIATRSPVELSKPYLTSMPDDQQYLVALSAGGEVLGFWALSVSSSVSIDKKQFVEALGGFADQISELLQLRNAYLLEESAVEQKSSVANLRATDLLRELLTSSDRRLTVFESAFDSQSTATVVYDLFGNVVQMNKMMGDILSRIGFAAYTATALDFLVKMTGQEQQACRSLLRYVILNRQRITIPVAANFTDELGQEFLVSLGPINPRENEVDSRLMKISGLMIEMQDVSAVQRASQLKQDIIERLGYRLRGDAESMILASSLLEEDDLDEETRREFVELLIEKVNSVTEVVDEVRSHLESTEVAVAGEACPVDSIDILKRVIARAEDPLQRKQLTLLEGFPQVGNLVMAESEMLAGFFTSVLQLLIQDAADASEISITVIETEQVQRISLINEGFGIPKDRFLHYLNDAESAAGPEFASLRKGKSRIESWGGKLSTDCAIGKGFEFEVELRTVF